MTKRLN